MRCLLGLALLFAWTAPVLAADFYVDAVGGSDANAGTTPGSAWRTLTHSVQQIAGGDTLHVLPGTYDPAHGEVFPLRPASGVTIIGDAGPEHTLVRAGAVVFDLDTANGGLALNVEGLTLLLSTRGFRCTATTVPSGCIDLTLRDVVLDRCSSGVYFRANNIGGLCHDVVFENVRVTGGYRGIDAENFDFCDLDLTVTDSTFEGLTDAAIWMTAGIETKDSVDLYRTRILDCGRGIQASHSSSGSVRITVEDSLVAGCGDGILGDTATFLRRSTIADSSGTGVDGGAVIVESILYGNGQDLVPIGGSNVSQSNIGSGVVPGAGNISVDPLFRDPDRRDYRLGFGTGCVDAIAATTGTDLTSFARGNDGDLDLVGARDMGAFELRTLDMPETLRIGEKLHIDLHGEIGNFGALYLARTTQLPAPLTTPFGLQWLPPGFLELVGMQKSLTSGPVRRTIFIPDSPALVGQAFSFQALNRSSNAPMGAAWTDAATVTFTL